MFTDLVKSAQAYFPNLKIAYKNESKFMKFIGTLLFFNKAFMTTYITTIGSTVYFPNAEYVNNNDKEASIVLLHEITHMYDSKKITRPIFTLGYLFPQILFLLFIPMLFVNWIVALCCLLFILPIPSPTRMYFEKRGYLVSLYSYNKLGIKNDQTALKATETFFESLFKNSAYYFMWVFNIQTSFDKGIALIEQNKIPFNEPNLFKMIDELISKI